MPQDGYSRARENRENFATFVDGRPPWDDVRTYPQDSTGYFEVGKELDTTATLQVLDKFFIMRYFQLVNYFASMPIKDQILSKLTKKDSITTAQVAGAFDISRNYAHILLNELCEEGVVVLIGKTNRARYVLASDTRAVKHARRQMRNTLLHLRNENLDEDLVYKQIERDTGIFVDVKKNVVDIVSHGFTEMLNNAIDHSESKTISVECRRTGTAITFTVRDWGIGIFNNVKTRLRLPGTLAAIQEILKGKATTAPQHHRGEGVFFTSKMADVFIVDSYDKRLTVNNFLPDIFISDRQSLKGTRVSFSVQLTSKRTPTEVFHAFTRGEEEDYGFDKTRITVKLYQFGESLPSRSEAKRVTMNLENFKVIELDFSGVDTVGQAFADEIFRVWQSRHPDIQLIPTNANENIEFMIQRAGGSTKQGKLPLKV